MKRFGTDGIRGPMGQAPMTHPSLQALALALGKKMQQDQQRRVCIAYDTRSSGQKIAALFTETLLSFGLDVENLGVMPTGILAWATAQRQHDVGLMITASHNPPGDNGIKWIDQNGRKWEKQEEERLIALWKQDLDLDWFTARGHEHHYAHAIADYLQQLSQRFQLDLTGKKLLLDCANGAASFFLPAWLQALGADVIALHAHPDGQNINLEAGCLNPQKLQEAVINHQAFLGIALDGDADRLVIVDDLGVQWDGDALIEIMVKLDLEANRPVPGVVLTEMSNQALVEALEHRGVPCLRTSVGDKYVARALLSQNWFLGGEPCGHLIDRQFAEVSDPFAILARLLESLKQQPLSAQPRFKARPQHQVNLKYDGPVEAVQAYATAHYPQVRWVIRASGTEAVLRIMGEHADRTLLHQAMDDVKQFCIYGIEG